MAPPAQDSRPQFSLLDLCLFVAFVAFFQGLATALGRGRLRVDGITFQLVALPVVVLLVHTGMSWSQRLARRGRLTGLLPIFALHLLGVAAVIGLLAAVLTVIVIGLTALGLIGLAVEIPLESDPNANANEFASLTGHLYVTAVLTVPVFLAIWVHSRLRSREPSGIEGKGRASDDE